MSSRYVYCTALAAAAEDVGLLLSRTPSARVEALSLLFRGVVKELQLIVEDVKVFFTIYSESDGRYPLLPLESTMAAKSAASLTMSAAWKSSLCQVPFMYVSSTQGGRL